MITRLKTLLLRIPRWLLSAVCLAAVLYLTLAPKPLPDTEMPLWEHTDKIVHALMFGGLCFCLGLDIWRGKRGLLPYRLLLAIGVGLFGGLIELLQNAMHLGRGGDWADFAADCAGSLLAIILL